MSAVRDFDKWLNTFRNNINSYKYYVDFQKIYDNVDTIRVQLNIMNSLIGQKNIEHELRKLLQQYPEILECIPILLAVRYYRIHAQDENGSFEYDFHTMNCSVDQYIYFMRETGLLELISNHIVRDLVDYVLGVETGLDSNARKNRGGHQMENLIESFIKKTGVEYYKEMYIQQIEEKWSIDLSAISANGTATKRFDFVVKTDNKVFGIETNFYTGGGSKLNETARSYKQIAQEAKTINDFEFVWITDGRGWFSARKNLKETFDEMEHLYNIRDLENSVLGSLFA